MTGAQWFKSSRSSGSKDCVEVAFVGGGLVGVRDSKDVSGPALVFTPGEWNAFMADLSGGKPG
nr:DUF397 domain-containing protein [Nocardia transvalensis]